MPRSGTTLIEQRLGRHSHLVAAGELEVVEALGLELTGTRAYPQGLTTLSTEVFATAARRWSTRVPGGASPGCAAIDKNPLNFEHLGLIMLAFPNARVIHCRRDPMDLCLSIYFQHFSERNDFAYNFADIAEYRRQYEQLMAHWQGVFPGRIHDVQYEALVADLESVSRGIFQYLDLEWDENCLEFHRTERPVGTASHWQVRQPLYTRSVGRWRNYEPYLEELRAVLSPGHG